MNLQKTLALGTTVIAASMATSALSYQSGDFIARAGWARVMPDSDNQEFSNVPGAEAHVDDADSLGLTFSYLITDNIGIGLLGAYPFKVDIDGRGTINSQGKVADVKALPPTLTMQYHFNTGPRLHPYVGAGVNYTFFYDEDTGQADGIFKDSNLDLENSWGLAGELGLDYEVNDDFLVSAQVWYIQMDTTARSRNVAALGAGAAAGAGNADVDINPWVFMLGVGKKF